MRRLGVPELAENPTNRCMGAPLMEIALRTGIAMPALRNPARDCTVVHASHVLRSRTHRGLSEIS